jgi:N-acetylglucosaminyldiphosphoundecaprenol N-acetyl-beta-D-mannosaminyltransferase
VTGEPPQLAPAPPGPIRPGRLLIGEVPLDLLTFQGALDAIEALVEAGQGGAVFTPNVDHVVVADRHREFREAYAACSLSLVDGVPVLWASRLLGQPLPEKISGSDLLLPLCRLAAARGWRVYILGGAPGAAREAATRLEARLGLVVAGLDDARIDLSPAGAEGARRCARQVRESRAQLLLVALGAPKQELWIHRQRAELGPVVAVGVGASIDFLAGLVRRAPPWMSRLGLEWLYRLVQEPRRLARRYLVEDVRFVAILWRTWRARRREAASRS